MNVAIFVAIAGAIIAPLVTYLVAARKMSGKVQTTEAAQLWEEARALRAEYRGQIDLLQAAVKDAIERVGVLEKNKLTLEMANTQLVKRVDDLEKELVSVKQENERLRESIEEKREQLAAKG